MISKNKQRFSPIRPLLLGLIFISGYSGTLLAADQTSPTLLSPENRSKISPSDNPDYQWNHVPGTSQYIFAIRDLQTREFIYNPSFQRLEADSICTDDVCTISSEDTAVMTDYGRYLWRVVAFDEDKKRMGASRSFLFVSGDAPTIPVIESPLHNSTHDAQVQPLYQWQASEGAKHYIIRLVDITTRATRNLVKRVKVEASSACVEGTCSYEYPEGLGAGKYRLVVRASNGFDLSKSQVKRFTVTPTMGATVDGYDWSLPSYAVENTQGGLVRDTWPNTDKSESYTNTSFYSIRWSDIPYTEPTEEGGVGSYDFGHFNWWMKTSPIANVENVLVRFEVNSVCDAPARLRNVFNYYAGGSIAFWEDDYIEHLGEFVNSFASQFAADERIKGVHLGIADGEYEQIQAFLENLPEDDKNGVTYKEFATSFCQEDDFNFYVGDDGWGEFWVNEEELKHAKSQGLTPDNFEASVKQIVDTYTDAFIIDGNSYTSKLAMTNLGDFAYNDPNLTIVSDDEIQPFNDIKNDVITPYVLAKEVGNRDGLIEDWMSYNNPLYGTGFKPGPNNACYMTLNEEFAEVNGHLYSGTENEEYGDVVSSDPEELDWITDRYGVYEGQPYRFMMSSLRALQMRRNHMQLNTDAMFDMTSGDVKLDTELKTLDFLHYLSSTIGRSKAETPDAFVVLGERYIRTTPEYIKGFSEADFSSTDLETCLVTPEDQTPYLQVREFGRWLTEVSGKGTKSNLVDLELGAIIPKTGLKDEDIEPWSIPVYLPEVSVDEAKTSTKYEYSARASNEFQFDINDAVVLNRCEAGVCDVEVKVVFQDTVATVLSLVTEAGVVGQISTDGLQGTKTVTFKVKGNFNNNLDNGADFALTTANEADALPVFMARVNFLDQPESVVPVLAAVTTEEN